MRERKVAKMIPRHWVDVGASYWVRMGVVVESKLSGGASGKECLPMQEMHKTWV